MKVFITGGTGFVGRRLTRMLIEKGNDVTVMARKAKPASGEAGPITYLAADGMRPGAWQEELARHDLVYNLAGVSVFKRWNDEYKRLLRESRILTTRNVVDALPDAADSDVVLINASGVGIYGFTGDEKLTEDAPHGTDPLARLAQDWEAEVWKAQDKGVRTATARFGIVLGRDGGALPEMVRPFRFFVGGPVGNGSQWVPWIHIDDVCRGLLFIAESSDVDGPLNFAAPEPVRNRDLAKAIGKALRRPSFMPAPAFALKLVLGEFGSVVLEGQRAVPTALLKHGFRFRYTTLDEALEDLLR